MLGFDLEVMFVGTFVGLAILCGFLLYFTSSQKSSSQHALTQNYVSFRNQYIMIFCLMMAGDWLQGPYVYALYQAYGFSVTQIGILFIAGFGSSLVFGTVVGSLADRIGRKKACLLYCLIYTASCVTKHWNNINVLLLGRVFGGIATSLLFSAFESWVIAESSKQNFDGFLWDLFPRAVFYGNGLTAILSGFLANTLVISLEMGPIAPFDAAAAFLTVGGLIIAFTWNENYGSRGSERSFYSQFSVAALAIQKDTRVLLLGCMQALFEGAMYTFVFLWTPTLSKGNIELPHGHIFANFMVSCMVGSALANSFMSSELKPEYYMQFVFGLASCCMLLTATIIYSDLNPELSAVISFTCFCLFEVAVGIFWPSMMEMRSQYVPEEVRSTVMNIFRMPLNVFVCSILFNVNDNNLGGMFLMCAAFLALALYCQYKLHSIITSVAK